VRSPALRTLSVTRIPGASPSPGSVAFGWTIIDDRRPFGGGGGCASRSISVSISRLGITTGGPRLSSDAEPPQQSRNSTVRTLLIRISSAFLVTGELHALSGPGPACERSSAWRRVSYAVPARALRAQAK